MRIRIPKLVKDTVWVTITNGLNYGINAIFGILIARLLEPSKYGIYGYWSSVFGIILGIIQFGIEGYLTRELSLASNKSRKKIFVFYVNLQLLLNLIIIFVFVLYFNLYLINDKINFIIGITALFLSVIDSHAHLVSAWYYSVEKTPFVSNIALLRNLLTVVSAIILLIFKVNILIILFVPVIFSVIRLIVLYYNIGKNEQLELKVFLKFKVLSLRKILKIYNNTKYFGLTAVFSAINAYCDPIILKSLGYVENQIGYFNAALKIKVVIALAGSSIFSVMMPRMVKEFKTSRTNFILFLEKILYLLLFANLSIIIIIYTYSDFIIKLIYGELYYGSAIYLSFFALGYIVSALQLLSAAITSIGKQSFIFYDILFISIFIPITKLILVKFFGNISIGWIEAVYPWLNFVVLYFYLNKTLKLRNSIEKWIKIFLLVFICYISLILMNYLNSIKIINVIIVFSLIFIYSILSNSINLNEVKNYVRIDK